MFRTADLSYVMPTHRLTVYLMGVALGYVLRHCGRDFKLKQVLKINCQIILPSLSVKMSSKINSTVFYLFQSHLTLGWTMALICLYLSVVSPSFMGTVGYKYEAIHAANYAAFAPITWCFLFGWIIFISYIGKGGKFSTSEQFHFFLFISSKLLIYFSSFEI